MLKQFKQFTILLITILLINNKMIFIFTYRRKWESRKVKLLS